MYQRGSPTPAPAPGPTEEIGVERSESPVSGGGPGAGAGTPPEGPALIAADFEAPGSTRRRQFSAEHGLCILEAGDACFEPVQVDGIVRRARGGRDQGDI